MVGFLDGNVIGRVKAMMKSALSIGEIALCCLAMEEFCESLRRVSIQRQSLFSGKVPG